MASDRSLLRKIALPYRIFFLYIEPVFALGGTYLCIADPQRFLRSTIPLPTWIMASPLSISPIIQLLLTNIGVLYALFAINESIVLRVTREKAVWYAIIGGMLVSDIGHIYAVWAVAPKRVGQILSWSGEEWINNGTLLGGALMRLAFLLGVGNA